MSRSVDPPSRVTWLAGILLSFGLLGSPVAAQTGEPIPGAGAWMFVGRLPGISGLVCSARTEGPQANSVLILNNSRVPILMAASPDWSGLEGRADISVSIDGAPPTPVEAYMAANLVMVMLSDEALLGRLRASRTIDWALPFGNFRANVEGLGVALDAVIACIAELND